MNRNALYCVIGLAIGALWVALGTIPDSLCPCLTGSSCNSFCLSSQQLSYIIFGLLIIVFSITGLVLSIKHQPHEVQREDVSFRRRAGRVGLVVVGIVLVYATLLVPAGMIIAALCLLIFGWIAIEGPKDIALDFAGAAIVIGSVSAWWELTHSTVAVGCAPSLGPVYSLFCTPEDLIVPKWALLGSFGAAVLVVGIVLRFRARHPVPAQPQSRQRRAPVLLGTGRGKTLREGTMRRTPRN